MITGIKYTRVFYMLNLSYILSYSLFAAYLEKWIQGLSGLMRSRR